jgi:hypothetical protein
MIIFLKSFNNRELAIIFWLSLLLICILFNKNIRKSIGGLLKAFINTKMLLLFSFMTLYVILIILFLHHIDIWAISAVKDTIIWFLFIAVVMVMNTNKANEDPRYFNKVLIDNIKLTIFLEFMINFYVFNIVIEIIMTPIMFALFGMKAIADIKDENNIMRKPLNFILSLLGIFLLVHAIYCAVTNYNALITKDNIISILLPSILTLSFIPFIYLFALLMAYEGIFWRLDFFLKENKILPNKIKRALLYKYKLNLNKINKSSKAIIREIVLLNDENEVQKLIKFIEDA